MSECLECNEPQVWGGQGWRPHTPDYHAGVRRRLMRLLGIQLHRSVQLQSLRHEAMVRGDVLVYWRNGAYRHYELYMTVPGGTWDTLDHYQLLREIRTGLAWQMNNRYGVEVNQATWLHRIYDDRTMTTPGDLERWMQWMT